MSERKWYQWADPKPTKPVERKSAVLGYNDVLGSFLQYGTLGATSASGALDLYEQSTAVSIPINIIGDHFAQIKPVLLLEDGTYDSDNDVIRFLQKPSPEYTRELFFEVLGKNYLICGEAGVVALGGVSRPPLELQPITPNVISVIEGTDGRTRSYDVSGVTLGGNYLRTPVKKEFRFYQGNMLELKFIRNFSTKSNSLHRGQSRLVSASREANQHILGGKHNVSLLTRGGRPTLVLHYAADEPIEDFDETKREVEREVTGVDGSGIIVTEGGNLTVQQLSTSNIDMNFSELQKMAQQAVALQYHIPLPLITVDAATLNNYQVALLALFDDAVLPLAGNIFGALSDFLLPRFGIDPQRVRITYNPQEITALQMRLVGEVAKRQAIGVYADNEIRKLLGDDPYDGGDVVMKPANLIPVGPDPLGDQAAAMDLEAERVKAEAELEALVKGGAVKPFEDDDDEGEEE